MPLDVLRLRIITSRHDGCYIVACRKEGETTIEMMLLSPHKDSSNPAAPKDLSTCPIEQWLHAMVVTSDTIQPEQMFDWINEHYDY